MAGEPEPQWITHAEAAAIVGCSLRTIARRQRRVTLLADTRLTARSRPLTARRSRPSPGGWKREQHGKQQKATQSPHRGGPPDDGDVWLDSITAGLVVGVSTQYLGRLTRQGRLPAARDSGKRKWWYRRSHIEAYAAARALASRRDKVSA
ncbi:helix-turn-helix domain-containing protein [Nocardioides pyridinolyticus]